MHIRTLGNTVQLCRWQVDYTVENPDETTTPMTEYVPTEEEADALVKLYSGTKLMLDTAADEWIDGIVVESLDQGREIAAMGEEKWKMQNDIRQRSTSEKLRADLDFLQVIAEV